MPIRTFAYFKVQVTGTPQPLCGSWITAGIAGPSKVPITLTLGTATESGNDATNIFKAGEYALIIDPNGANAETVLIQSVLNNTVTLGFLNQTSAVTTNSHVSGVFATGSFIIPLSSVNNAYVQALDGNTGELDVGTVYNMKAPGGTPAGFRMVAKLVKVASGTQPVDWSATIAFGGDAFNTSEFWVVGTANDQYLPSFGIL